MEDCYMGKATERLFLPLIKKQLPEVIDMNLPLEGVFHNLCFVSIDKRYPGQPRKVMYALWGLGQMMFTKIIVVVDANVNVQNVSEVLWRIGNNVDPRRDLVILEGPLDALDHAADRFAFGSKVGIDATRKSRRLDVFPREWPGDLAFPEALLEQVTDRWDAYGLG